MVLEGVLSGVFGKFEKMTLDRRKDGRDLKIDRIGTDDYFRATSFYRSNFRCV
jgi:hypothetical protein